MIRSAKISDLDALTGLVKSCISDMKASGVEQWPDWYPNRDTLKKDILESVLFIAETEKGIAGMVSLSPEVPLAYKAISWNLKSGKVNSIHRLAVHPQNKTPGLAKKLVEFVEHLAKKQGYQLIRLDTYSKNMAANKFYRKMGYQYVGDIHLKFMPDGYHCFEKALYF